MKKYKRVTEFDSISSLDDSQENILVNDKMFLKGSIRDSRQFLYVKDCVKILGHVPSGACLMY